MIADWYSDIHPSGEAERALLTAFMRARGTVDWSNLPDKSQPNPKDPGVWHEAHTIRAQFFSDLCKAFVESAREKSISVSIQKIRFTLVPGKGNMDRMDLSDIHTPFVLRFDRCRFECGLDISQSHFYSLDINNCWLPWISAYSSTIDASLSLDGSTIALDGDQSSQAPVYLGDAKVGGELSCSSMTIGALKADAHNEILNCNVVLDCESLDVGRSFFISHSTIRGKVSLVGAIIGGDLDCSGAALKACDPSLKLEKVEIGGVLYFGDEKESKRFNSIGSVVVSNSVIRNGFSAGNASFELPHPVNLPRSAPRDVFAISIEKCHLSGDTNFSEHANSDGISIRNSELGFLNLTGSVADPGVDLRGTKTQSYFDYKQHWPDKLRVDGFVYQDIRDAFNNPEQILVDDRLDWLDRDAGASTQPYIQLANVLKDHGEDDGATKVLVRMQKRTMDHSGILKRSGLRLYELVDFGYKPEWSFWGLLGLTGIGWIIYRRASLARAMVPTDKDAYKQFKDGKGVPGEEVPHYAGFSPLMYSLENTFPLVDLGQGSQWQPKPGVIEPEKRKEQVSRRLKLLEGLSRLIPRSWGEFLRIFLWFQILLGWLLATLFLAGVGNFIRR